MGFSVFVEMLNLRLARRRREVADLGEPHVLQEAAAPSTDDG